MGIKVNFREQDKKQQQTKQRRKPKEDKNQYHIGTTFHSVNMISSKDCAIIETISGHTISTIHNFIHEFWLMALLHWKSEHMKGVISGKLNWKLFVI